MLASAFLIVGANACFGSSATPGDFTGTDILLRLVSVLVLIAINAFFVTAEFSIVSVRRSRINQLADAGDPLAKTVQDLQRNIDRLLSTTQLGITLSSLALGWVGENTMAIVVTRVIVQLPFSRSATETLAHSLAIPLAFLLVAYLQIVLGELCPKSVALLYSEQLAKFLGTPSLAIARFFNPFIWILNQSTRLLLSSVGIRPTGTGWYHQITSEELQLMIAGEGMSIGLKAEERELLNNIFEFGNIAASEVMIPRISVTALPLDGTFRDLLTEVVTTGHSRYPVMGDSLDDIRGVIDFKELAEPLGSGVLTLDTQILRWIKPARFVPESTPLRELLQLMQRSHAYVVIVVDEYGGTVGLVTINDILAKIIGERIEVDPTLKSSIQILDERTFLVQAQLELERVNEQLKLNLPLSNYYQTLGGFLIDQMEKIPNVGEIYVYNNLEFTVISARGARLNQIQIQRLGEK
ncbi:hemolysin family protein [Ancylothrix sp. D3o]|uniref:hemolysin family protein n=1 Tax=Ancylothrix sp. D3o TaxID=2953691 RepID=UPI0021BAF341|nr:hemolysin family protein [Ancylothrix sp. D3o]